MHNEIFKKSTGYFTLKFYTSVFFRLYYKSYRVINQNNQFNNNDVVIYAINHQNALIDALALLFARKGAIVFMARADIFKNKTTARILKFLKILPVYRMRDGFENLQNNTELFNQIVASIHHGVPLAILPEGSHLGKHTLRPLKKGLARIAFSICTNQSDNKRVAIVPVGIDYSEYFYHGSLLQVTFGKPFYPDNLMGLFLQNQAKALNELTSQIYDSIRKIIVHFDDNEHYYLYEGLYQHFILTPYKNINYGIAFSKKISQLDFDKDIAPIKSEFNDFIGLSNKFKIQPNVNMHFWKILIAFFLLLPLWLTSELFKLPYTLLRKKIMKNVKDFQFHSSFSFVLAVIFYTLFIPLLIIIILCFKNWFWALSSGLMYILILYAGQYVKSTIYQAYSALRLKMLQISKPEIYRLYIEKRTKIQNWVNKLIQ